MKIKILLLTVVLLGLLFSLSASAVITDPSCGIVPIQKLNYINTTQVDKFDSSLGDLKSVTVTVDACGYASRLLTNLDPISGGVNYSAILTANMISDIPGIGQQNFQIGTTDNFHLAPNESYTIQIGSVAIPQCDHQNFTLTAPAEMAPYIGNAGDKVQIPVSTKSNILVDGSTEWSSNGSTFMGVTVCVEYEYEPLCINGTKISDCTELGLEGWTINLLRAGNVIQSDITGSDGSYSFCNLSPGTYTVEEVLPAGWVQISAPGPITLARDDANGQDFRNRIDCNITTTPFSVCPGVTVTKEMILGHVTLNGCSGTPTVAIGEGNTYTVSCTSIAGCPCSASGSWDVYPACTLETTPFSVCPGVTVTKEMILENVDTSKCTDTPTVNIGPGNTYTISCTDENGCPCNGSGSWTVYPACTLETTPFSVCPGVTVTEAMILENVDTSKCTDTPTVNIGPGNTYTISCTDENGCPCNGSGSWTVYPACTLETTPFSVCPGVTVTEAMILENVDTSKCTDTPTVNIGPGNTYTISCTDENGCPCTGSGSWTEYPECIIETESFSVPCNAVPTDDEILAHVDLNSECADTPVITRGAGNTYTVSCTDENGCPCTGSGSWTVEPCEEACETAWAFLEGGSCWAKTGNWGSLTEITPGESLTLTGDMWAGRAKCDPNKGINVGTATITVSANGYVLDFDLNGDCHVEDLHVWVDNAKPDVKGGFSDKRWYKSESMNNLHLDLTKPIWVAIHTETCC